MKVLNYVFALLMFIAIISMGVTLVCEIVNNYNAGVIDMTMTIICVFGYLVLALFLIILVIAIIKD